jgi:hypothetical protein
MVDGLAGNRVVPAGQAFAIRRVNVLVGGAAANDKNQGQRAEKCR